MSNYADLLAQKIALEKQTADLERRLAEVRRSERAGVIAKVKALLAEHGLTTADLGGVSGGGKKSSLASDSKVAPKYRNPVTGDTWTGRGLKPKWVQAAIANGKTMDDLKI